MRNPNIKESNPHSYIRWREVSKGFRFNVKMLITVKGTGTFYAALGNSAQPAPNTLTARLLGRQYVQTQE